MANGKERKKISSINDLSIIIDIHSINHRLLSLSHCPYRQLKVKSPICVLCFGFPSGNI